MQADVSKITVFRDAASCILIDVSEGHAASVFMIYTLNKPSV
jgi:hypothetical protein